MDWLKMLHITCAVLSVGGYFVRGLLTLGSSPLLAARFIRIAPHVVDTLLLASAIALAVRLQQYPFVHGWLTAKVLALVAYIVLGAIGLKYGRTRNIRAAAGIAALATFGYIVAVALTRQPFIAPA
jgi:uncharacterized membrane protein SirB2